MKKILLTIAIAAISASSAFAQESPAQGLRWKGIMNNGFWSNWEITVGGGVNYTAWNGVGLSDQEAIGDLGWMVEGGLTKWFNPIVGTRVFLAVGKLNSSDDNGVTGGWIMPHADALINLSNWIGGYREDRVYYAKVFAGFGASFVNVNNDGSAGFAFNAGLLNSFRVCDALDINLELKGILTAGRDMPRVVSSLADKYGQIYTATVGITYRFNKRNWDKAYTQEEIDGYLAAIDALESGLADAHRNEGKLAERLAAQKAATDQAMKDNEALRNELAKKQDKVISSTAIFFNFDSAKLLERAKASLQILQETINAAPKSQVFTLVGHADVKTGTAEYNQKLSERRAKAVYDYLVEQGVNPDQLTWKGVGSTQNIFPINGTNRVVIVK